MEDSGNRHAHSYKFQSRNIEEEKGNNSENNQTYDFLVSIKQVKDQPHDSMGSRVTVWLSEIDIQINLICFIWVL